MRTRPPPDRPERHGATARRPPRRRPVTRSRRPTFALLLALAACPALAPAGREPADGGLALAWADNILTVRGRDIPGGEVKVWYMEAFCRPGSTDRDWKETVIPHATELVEASPDG